MQRLPVMSKYKKLNAWDYKVNGLYINVSACIVCEYFAFVDGP